MMRFAFIQRSRILASFTSAIRSLANFLAPFTPLIARDFNRSSLFVRFVETLNHGGISLARLRTSICFSFNIRVI